LDFAHARLRCTVDYGRGRRSLWTSTTLSQVKEHQNSNGDHCNTCDSATHDGTYIYVAP
jgi:hypothetical protein